ncbi:MAG: hypothetical protein EXR11_04090 [Rhodospirillaceae bacterium]|nr:hypothetical protein [Rhodospirillaceae bacterium]
MARKTSKSKTKPKASKPSRAKAKPIKAKTAAAKNAAAKPALPKDLEKRLWSLAKQMEKTMGALMLQALCEFADAWEEHCRTVKALQDDDRVQLAVKPE